MVWGQEFGDEEQQLALALGQQTARKDNRHAFVRQQQLEKFPSEV